MKAQLALASLILATACGAATPENTAAPSSLDAPASIVFANRGHLADGVSKEVSLVRNSAGLYDSTERTMFYDRISGRLIDKTSALVNGMTCQIAAREVACVRSDSFHEGPIQELTFRGDANGYYEATLDIRALAGGEFRVIGTGMTRRQAD